MSRIAIDPYPQDLAAEQGSPWHNCEEITPSDEDELKSITRALYVGVSGDIHLLMINGSEFTFRNAAQGFELGLRIRKIFKSGTTADGLIGLY